MDKLIFDNIIFSLQKAGGISVVWEEILKGLSREGISNYLCLEYPGSEKNIFRKGLIIPADKIRNFRGPLNMKRFFSPKINIEAPTIFHSSYYRTMNNQMIKNITTVHDFTYEIGTKGIRRQLHTWQKNKAIYGSDIVVCISNNTKKDLERFCPGIDKRKIKVIYNGVSNDYFPLEESQTKELKDSVLFIGMRGGHKNFRLTVESLAETPYKLLICGSQLTEEEKKMLNNYLGKARYEYMGRVSNQELNRLYNSVLCLAYPSSYEGFGIPVLEAQRANCPVIALNSSSIPEVMGNKDFLMRKVSITEFKDRLKMIENMSFREELISEGREFSKKFSWEKMAKEYIDLYQELSINE